MNPEHSTRESFGGSSRDEEQGGRSQRRTASSSGFLVDTFLPRTKSVRQSVPQSRSPEIDHRMKRGKSEAAPAPRKRSRFRWSRHKGSTKESADISQEIVEEKEAEGTPNLAGSVTARPELQGQSSSQQTGSRAESRDDQAGLGLDKDSLQIVNLALNLSESRKGHAGYQSPDPVAGGTWASSSDGRASAAGSAPSHGSYRGHHATQTMRDDRVKISRPSVPVMTNDVINSLPKSAVSDSTPQGFSGGTLARAASARRHFELRHEYLRLLPSLPPLKTRDSTADSGQTPDEQHAPHRIYNPLQAIRNRKVRFRERCPIDPEAEGWNDIDKVHSWINSIETGYIRKARTSLECLKLPPFEGRRPAPLDQEMTDGDVSAASPPSSLRRVSRTGSLKARRPRLDWLINPEELLADAAWVEDAENKSRMINKDGNTLYPDPSFLVFHDAHQEQAQGRASVGTGRPSSYASQSDARQRLPVDMKDFGRGRQPHGTRAPQSIGRNSSVSDQDLNSKRRRFRVRARSSSSSSDDDKPRRDFFQSNLKSPKRSVSPPRPERPAWHEKRGSLSSVPSADDRYDAKMGGHAPATGMDIGFFPSIASNLSPPSSRSSSPAKRGFRQAVGHRRAHSRNSFYKKGDDDSSVDCEAAQAAQAARKDSVQFADLASDMDIETPQLPAKASTYHIDGRKANFHERKDSGQHESKLRGIFKGPGKIAGKVGNEVSKMGDFILKKDSAGHSRQSSLAISDTSDSSDDEIKSEKRGLPKAILRRLPTFNDDLGRSSPRTSDKSLAKNTSQTPPTIVESRYRDQNDPDAANLVSSQGRLLDLQGDASNSPGHHGRLSGHFTRRAPRFLQFGPEIHTIRDEIRKGRIKDNSVPFSMARPPMTGLAGAQPTPMSSSRDVRPSFSGQSRSWSISDRSVSISIESGVPGKQEVERNRALLLSSGIKAREIVRRAESVRSPPPEFLQRSFDSDESMPSVPRLYEHQLASRKLLNRIEWSHNSFQSSIERVPKVAFSPLKSQLSTLEDLVNKSLNTRIHAAGDEAENLSMQLNTTSTLAVRRLSDTLEHSLRKRHRRLRWLRRTGFMMLEWALVGLLWWVWLIVVAFRLLRKLLYGMVSSVRWILWL